MSTTTEQRKGQAVQAMHTEIGNAGGPEAFAAADIAAKIRELAPVVRSAKWQDAVERYARFVEIEANEGHLNWAYFQGSVDFAYAVFS